jgi:hypothetical protein
MADKFDLVIAVDPGVSGGISLIFKNGKVQAYPIPVQQTIVNKKKKKVYDLTAIVDLLKPYVSKKVLFIQERVASRPGEGSVSSFGFGKSAGLTVGMAVALGFEVVEISPATWKKHFPELSPPSVVSLKEEIKKIRAENKSSKDKKAIKENNKEADRLNRQIKAEAKSAARELISSMYPDLASMFCKKNSDGIAESLLIARYGRDKQDELVQGG